MGKTYLVSDGKLVLTLEEAGEGGYTVTSPMDPGLVTEAETVSEAFDMARDALQTLREARAVWLEKTRHATAGRRRSGTGRGKPR